mgnify:FL=1
MHVPDMEVERAYTLFEEVITDHFGERMKTDDDLCSRIWSSLANVDWYYVKGEKTVSVGYSFRAAGSMIAGIRGFGDYMDWYCSGPDADVAPEFRRLMKKNGFIADTMGTICDEPGCLNEAGSGWSSDTGYRVTCFEHSAFGKK